MALEDGAVFEGYAFGACGEAAGEVVFNTSMTGYQEILTDPSYAGQIVAMTYPLIGNYGVSEADFESGRPHVEAFAVRENARRHSNWRADGTLEELLKRFGIPGIEGIDTRRLTRHIRSRGAMKGVLSSLDLDKDRLVRKAVESPGLVGRDLVSGVTTDAPYHFDGESGSGVGGEAGGVASEGASGATPAQFNVVAFDFGVKTNILRCLAGGGNVTYVVPAQSTSEEVLSLNPDGVFLSNGPGDPEAVGYAIRAVRGLLGKVPVFGICLGHQILSLAMGGKTYKLKFGHRGGNQPVKNLLDGKVEITAQNHGFAVDPGSLKVDERDWQIGGSMSPGGWPGEGDFGRIEITHLNLNDGTVEGLRCLDIPALSVQYHPEASPGPHDSKYLFEQFKRLMASKKRGAQQP